MKEDEGGAEDAAGRRCRGADRGWRSSRSSGHGGHGIPVVDPAGTVTLDAVRERGACSGGDRRPHAARRTCPPSPIGWVCRWALKCEQLQPIGAFKIRGAYTAIARIAREGRGQRCRHPVQRQPRTSHRLRGPARSDSGPSSSCRAPRPQVKVDGVRRHGGEVVFAGAVRSAEQGERAEADRAGRGARAGAAVRPSRRRDRAGDRGPRDSGAASRRRDDPRRR